MKRHPNDEGDVRTLAGHHDLDAFVEAANADRVWRRAALRFGHA